MSVSNMSRQRTNMWISWRNLWTETYLRSRGVIWVCALWIKYLIFTAILFSHMLLTVWWSVAVITIPWALLLFYWIYCEQGENIEGEMRMLMRKSIDPRWRSCNKCSCTWWTPKTMKCWYHIKGENMFFVDYVVGVANPCKWVEKYDDSWWHCQKVFGSLTNQGGEVKNAGKLFVQMWSLSLMFSECT